VKLVNVLLLPLHWKDIKFFGVRGLALAFMTTFPSISGGKPPHSILLFS